MVKDLKVNSNKTEQAKHMLGYLLDVCLEMSCTDGFHDLEKEFKEILGEYCPDWLDPDREV